MCCRGVWCCVVRVCLCVFVRVIHTLYCQTNSCTMVYFNITQSASILIWPSLQIFCPNIGKMGRQIVDPLYRDVGRNRGKFTGILNFAGKNNYCHAFMHVIHCIVIKFMPSGLFQHNAICIHSALTHFTEILSKISVTWVDGSSTHYTEIPAGIAVKLLEFKTFLEIRNDYNQYNFI